MARSEWPRGRWLVAYSDMWGTTKTLREAKRHVDIRLGALLRQPGPVRLAIPINAVIVRVGSEVAYRGRIYGTKHKRMHWTRVRPADPVRRESARTSASPRVRPVRATVTTARSGAPRTQTDAVSAPAISPIAHRSR